MRRTHGEERGDEAIMHRSSTSVAARWTAFARHVGGALYFAMTPC
jgi:hypothetical protein